MNSTNYATTNYAATNYVVTNCSRIYSIKYVFANGYFVGYIFNVALGTIAGLLAILFNGVVAFICISKKFDQQSMQFLILRSPLFDIITAVVTLSGYIPISVLALYHRHLCFLLFATTSVGFLSSTVNITTITLLAIDRYISICHPLKFQNFISRSKIYYRRSVLAVVIVNAIVLIIDFLTANNTVYLIFLSLFFCIAISISLFTFLKIFKEHKKICRIMPLQTPGQIHEAKQKEKQVKLAKVIFIVILTSILCYGTIVASAITWMSYGTSAPDSVWIQIQWSYVIYILKSVINPSQCQRY